MKILVLNNDLKERTVIQQALQSNGHEMILAENSEAAMQQLQEGGIHFVIADRVGTDVDEKQFIKRLRDAKPPYYIYILLITAKVQEGDITVPRTSADDYLHKPVIPIELKSRVHIAERILSLRDHLVQAKDTLENSAMLDTTTNVLNQKAFLILSRGELERARRGQAPFSLIALDVDNFKSINEKYGREIGNDVLTVIGKAIREKSRPYDNVGRYENDTFLITLPGVIAQDAEKVAERILKGILNTNISLLNGNAINISVSAGIVCSTRITAATEIDMLIRNAQDAVAHAQREGGNRSYIVFM
jgi:two-component system chemotaxis response regulator CheY